MADKLNSQMLKGVLTGCILILLSKEELYGYKLSERLSEYGFANISNGTIYPLLLTLEKKHYIEGEMRESENGPQRKYYLITDSGLAERDAFLEQWQELLQSVNKLAGEMNKNED